MTAGWWDEVHYFGGEDLRSRFYASQRPATGDGRIVDELPPDCLDAGTVAPTFTVHLDRLALASLPAAELHAMDDLLRHLPPNAEAWRVDDPAAGELLLQIRYRRPSVTDLPEEPNR